MSRFLKIDWSDDGIASASQSLQEDLLRVAPGPDGYTVEDFLQLDGSYRIEFNRGCIEVAPWVDEIHQELVGLLVDALHRWARENGCAKVIHGPFFVRLNQDLWRNPDVIVMLDPDPGRRRSMYWDRADVIFEVVGDDADHDRVTKRAEYAAAGIPEYWIVDPENESVTVFALPEAGGGYLESGRFHRGQIAAGKVLAGFSVDVATMFDTARARA